MKTVSPSPAEQGEGQLPFPTEQLPAEVINSYDREQIGELLASKLDAAGIALSDVVLSGFNAEQVLKMGGFGDRNTTFGLGGEALFTEDNDVSPLNYLEEAYGGRPAVGVFYVDRLLGGLTKDDLGEVSPEELRNRSRLFIFWKTKDGESLDKAVAKVFLF